MSKAMPAEIAIHAETETTAARSHEAELIGDSLDDLELFITMQKFTHDDLLRRYENIHADLDLAIKDQDITKAEYTELTARLEATIAKLKVED
jgi:hypothetical protein